MPLADQPWNVFSAECPSRRALTLIADKWTTLVLHALGTHGTQRHGELRRRIEGISEKMLTQTLRDLQRNGLVARTDHGEIPPRVDYALTPLGATLQRTVTQLCAWVTDHMAEVRAAQATFDEGPQVDAPWQRAAGADLGAGLSAGRGGPGSGRAARS